MADKKCYVVLINHIVYGTEVVGACSSTPTRETMEKLARKYITRYSFDQSEKSLDLEFKQITDIHYVAVRLDD